jgi:hypothetical protein
LGFFLPPASEQAEQPGTPVARTHAAPVIVDVECLLLVVAGDVVVVVSAFAVVAATNPATAKSSSKVGIMTAVLWPRIRPPLSQGAMGWCFSFSFSRASSAWIFIFARWRRRLCSLPPRHDAFLSSVARVK